MTQLFDTANYDHQPTERHLRSIEAPVPGSERAPGPVWRLDDDTIAIGRRGIERAREALRRTGHPGEPKDRRAA